MAYILQRVSDLIRRYPDKGTFFGAVPEDQIREAERLLGGRFPESYRWFVANYGAGRFGACEFLGLIPGRLDARYLNVVEYNLRARRDNYVETPYLVIGEEGNGELYVIKQGEPESPVWIWFPVIGDDRLRRYRESFEHMLLTQIESSLPVEDLLEDE